MRRERKKENPLNGISLLCYVFALGASSSPSAIFTEIAIYLFAGHYLSLHIAQ